MALTLEEKNKLQQLINNAYDKAKDWKDGWKPFAALGSKELKDFCISLGFISIKKAIECVLDSQYQFKDGDTSKHEPPKLISRNNIQESISSSTLTKGHVPPHEVRNMYRELLNNPLIHDGWVMARDLMNRVHWSGTPTEFSQKYSIAIKAQKNAPTLMKISNIAKFEIKDDIFFDPQNKSYPQNLAILKDMALQESWNEEGSEKKNGLLDNYLCYTYARVKEEKKLNFHPMAYVVVGTLGLLIDCINQYTVI